MKLEISADLGELKAAPLKKSELLRALKIFEKMLKPEPEWKLFLQHFGRAPAVVALRLIGDEEMRKVYQAFRGRRKTTDVLSFPTLEINGLELFKEEELSLGDIVISLPAVLRGARRARRSFRAEFLEVFLHGLLHLLGLDHVLGKKVTKKQATRMRKLQADLFGQCKALIKV